MSNVTNDILEGVTITLEEKRALTALLRTGMTIGVLQRMGLEGLEGRLSAAFNGPWQFDTSKDRAPTLETYRVPQENNVIVQNPY